MNAPYLLGQILWYEAVGLLLCVALFSIGGLLYTLLTRSKQPRPLAEVLLASYPLGLLGLGLLAVLACTGTLGQLACLALIIGAGLWTHHRRWAHWQPLRRALPVVLLFAVAVGALFGTLWHGPGPSYAGSTMPDMAVYNAYAQYLHFQLFPVVNLNTLGDILPSGYINLFPALLAAATSTSFADDAVLFYAVSGPVVMIVSFGLMAVCLVEILTPSAEFSDEATTSEGVTIFQLIVAGVLMVGAWRYPSWVVESPPVALALPLCISMYYFALRPARTAIQGGFIVLSAMLTKVVTLVPFGALTVGAFFNRATLTSMKRSQRAALGAALVTALAFAAVIFINYKALILQRLDFFQPDSLRVFGGGGLSHDFAVTLSRDLGLVLLIVAAIWSRHRLMIFVTLAGTLAYFASTMWFRWSMTASIILFALALTQSRPLFRRSNVLVVLASVCLLYAALGNADESTTFLLFWLLWIGLFALLFSPKEVWSGADVWHKRSRFAVKVLSVLALGAVVGAAFSPLVHETLDNRKRPVVSSHVYDIQKAVRRHTPKDALLFVERVPAFGAHAPMFASYGRRQVFFSGERVGWLRRDPEALARRQQTNKAVWSGETHPDELLDAFPQVAAFDSVFVILRGRRKPPPHFRQVYSNKAMILYKIAPAE